MGINFEIMSHCNEAVLLRDVMVHADVHKLGQVVRNLVSNALKFTPAGGRVTLDAKLVPGGGAEEHRVRFEVSDTGPGISQVRTH